MDVLHKLMSIKLLRWTILIILSPLWVPLWLCVSHSKKIEKTFYEVNSFASDIREIWKFFVVIIHSVGWLATISILSASIYALGCSVLLEFVILTKQPDAFLKLSNIFQNQFAWAAATSIVGGTVAIGHVWNLELNREKFYEERRERYRKNNKQ